MMRIVRATTMFMLGILAACGAGGVGSGGSVAPPPNPTVQPPSTRGAFAFHIIGIGKKAAAIGVAAAGSTPVLPPGYQVGGPVANAIVVYPDGSTQQADANGVFDPANSSYAIKYPTTLQISAYAQPFIKIGDPAGGSTLGAANVSPYANDSTARIGGIALLPSGTQLFSDETLTLIASAVDVDDRVASLGSIPLQWSSALGATITPIPGTNQATYVAPLLSAGSENDTVTVTAAVPGIAGSYSATALVTTFSPAAGVLVSGTLSNGSSNLPGGVVAFVESDSPRVFPSFNFFASGDANASFSRLLPPNISLQLALSLIGTSGAGSGVAFAPASLLPSGDTSITTGSSGSSVVANVALASSSEFEDQKDDAKNAIPDPIVNVRDAWFVHQFTRIYPFWADSGVNALFASPSHGTVPPQPVGNGLFAQWCFQWQTTGSVTALVLVENADSSCTAAGNEAFVVAPQAGPGAFNFSEYRAGSGGYSLSGTLQPSLGAQLVAAGSWQQTPVVSGGIIASDIATVSISFYGPISQLLSVPVSQLSEQYAYTATGGSSTAQISNAILFDPVTSLNLANASATLTSTATPTSCVGTAATCYQASAQITRIYNVIGAPATHAYSANDTLAGDGSSLDVVTSAAQSDASSIRIPIAAATTRAAGSCVVCSSAAQLIDEDGITQLGSFGVDSNQAVRFMLLDSAEGGGAGSTVGVLTFHL